MKHALKLLEQSADQGLQQAQLFLGLCYFDSKDIPQDLEKAAELLRAAASQKVSVLVLTKWTHWTCTEVLFVVVESSCSVQSGSLF